MRSVDGGPTPRKPSTSMLVRKTAAGALGMATAAAGFTTDPTPPATASSTALPPANAARTRPAAPSAGGAAAILSITRRSSVVSGIGNHRRGGHAFQHDLVRCPAMVDKVRRASAVLLEMDQGADLE